MHRKLQLLTALKPTSHFEKDQEVFDLIFDRVFQQLEERGIFTKLLPILNSIEHHEYKTMTEMDKLFTELRHYTTEMRKVIYEEKENLEIISQEVNAAEQSIVG